MRHRGWIGSSLLLLAVVGAAGALAAWKRTSLRHEEEAAARHPEPSESVTVATAVERQHVRTTTAIGTVLALRSVTLRNELAGTVREVSLNPGQVVEAGALLVALDVSVEEAELKAHTAEAELAKIMLDRTERAGRGQGAAAADVDRAHSQLEVARAQIERTKAVIARKTIRAPFRARVGLADVHPGQYLAEGTQLTTLQGVDDAVQVDFSVPQTVAAGLKEGDAVEVSSAGDAGVAARIVAVDARVDPATRNAQVRARIEGAGPAPGASVRVRVPVGGPRAVVAVPVSALRKGPDGDRVFVIAPDEHGKTRARARPVESGSMLPNDEVAVLSGLAKGQRVAASGSFKLRDGVLVTIANEPGAKSE